MRWLVIVAIVFAVQPTKPENSQRASQSKTTHSTQQSDSTNNNRNDSHVPSVSVTVNNAPASPNPNSNADESNENMRTQRRLAFYTGLLVFVGFVTAGVLIWQSVETHRSANAAKKAADAALLNAQAVINVERPWILAEVHWEEGVPSPEPTLSGWVFQAVNKGQTPAEIVSLYFEKEFVSKPDDLPIPPKYKSPIIVTGDSLMVRDEKWPLSRAPIHVESWMENTGKRELVMNAQEFPVFYGEVVYRDTLRDKTDPKSIHHTRWCFVYDAFIQTMIPSGPEEYRTKS